MKIDITFICFGLALVLLLMYMVGERIYWMTTDIIPDKPSDYIPLGIPFGILCIVGFFVILYLRDKLRELYE